ncbi:hypothetical protein NK6_3400 [Bradyrhizobium diazoefficiens]|uniref:Uncharacterized protein n=1 Tax=Bradyrhizobium diazoefficiens TaxID=1355477 RepID=A0A0E4BNC9_9BRAD|nr:hypothetical protein NK6_3400 [Bradyrhizobium diazoefficiens]
MACARLRRLPALPRRSIVPGINKALVSPLGRKCRCLT